MRIGVSAGEPLGLTAPTEVDWSDPSRLAKLKGVGLVALEVDRALSERLAMPTSCLPLSLAAVVGFLPIMA